MAVISCRRAEHLDRTAEDDDPVVVVVGGREQHLAGAARRRSPSSDDDRQLLVVELGEGDIAEVVGHGRRRYPPLGRGARDSGGTAETHSELTGTAARLVPCPEPTC